MEAHWPQARACCLAHDAAYDAGGTDRDRLLGDVGFFLCLLRLDDMPMGVAEQAYNAVRIFGGLYFSGGGDETPVPPPRQIVQAP